MFNETPEEAALPCASVVFLFLNDSLWIHIEYNMSLCIQMSLTANDTSAYSSTQLEWHIYQDLVETGLQFLWMAQTSKKHISSTSELVEDKIPKVSTSTWVKKCNWSKKAGEKYLHQC